MEIEFPVAENTPTSHLPFSPATRVGHLIFVSGQASVDKKGNIVPDTFEGEVRRSLKNLRAVLEGAGSSLRHIVQIRNYVRDPENLESFNRLYQEYFQRPYPARTTITNCLPDTIQFEVECVAVSAT